MERSHWRCLGLLVLNVVASDAYDAYADPINVGWAQPAGPGSAVNITYSYSNLFDGGFNTTLSPVELQRSTELAFGVWARYAPLNFFEVPDSGPSPSDYEYGNGYPGIRIGYQPRLNIDSAALAYFPLNRSGSAATGLAGDIHFSNDLSAADASTWGTAVGDVTTLDFFSVLLHEIGHSLGIAHILDDPAIMSDTFVTVFARREDADLRPADIRAIRALYGTGIGSVHPLVRAEPTPEPTTLVLLATGLALFLRRARFRGSAPRRCTLVQ